jgi:hypothetical protein
MPTKTTAPPVAAALPRCPAVSRKFFPQVSSMVQQSPACWTCGTMLDHARPFAGHSHARSNFARFNQKRKSRRFWVGAPTLLLLPGLQAVYHWESQRSFLQVSDHKWAGGVIKSIVKLAVGFLIRSWISVLCTYLWENKKYIVATTCWHVVGRCHVEKEKFVTWNTVFVCFLKLSWK